MESIVKRVVNPQMIKVTKVQPLNMPISLSCEKAEVLSVKGDFYLISQEGDFGRALIKGKALFTLVTCIAGVYDCYQTFAQAEIEVVDERITPSSLVDMCIKVEECEVLSSNGGGLEVVAQISASCCFCAQTELSLIEDIDGAIVKTEEIPLLSYSDFICEKLSFDGEKSFNYFIEKVLYHKDSAFIRNVTCGMGEVSVEGEIYTEFLLLKKSGEKAIESMLTPFSADLPCDNAQLSCKAFLNACFNGVNFKISSEEDEESAVIMAEYDLTFIGALTSQIAVNRVIDGFCNSCDLQFNKEEQDFSVERVTLSQTQKCFGEGDLTLEQSAKVIATMPAECYDLKWERVNGKLEVSTVIACQVIVEEGEKVRSEKVQLPYTFSLECENDPYSVEGVFKNCIARLLEGKCIVECEGTFVLSCEKKVKNQIVTEVVFGEERQVKSSAISVVFISKGDDLWTVCKKAGASEQTILNDNPDMVFPASQDKAVVVYRKL